jgi:hypothetical protein
MNTPSLIRTAFLYTLWLAYSQSLLAYRTGPPIAETGAMGETTCVRCHGGPAASRFSSLHPFTSRNKRIGCT